MKTSAVCAALLIVALCYGGVAAGDRLSSDLRAVQGRYSGVCPPYTGNGDNCTIYDDECTSDSDCQVWGSCCPKRCGLYCFGQPTTAPELPTTPPKLPTTPASDATPVTDRCYRYTLIKIFCHRKRNFCFSDNECKSAQICCPYGNCGNRCVSSS